MEDLPDFKITAWGPRSLVDVAEVEWWLLVHPTESRPVVLELRGLRGVLAFTSRDKAEALREWCPAVSDARLAKVRDVSAFLDKVHARGDEVLIDPEDDGEGGFFCRRHEPCVMVAGGEA